MAVANGQFRHSSTPFRRAWIRMGRWSFSPMGSTTSMARFGLAASQSDFASGGKTPGNPAPLAWWQVMQVVEKTFLPSWARVRATSASSF